MTTFYHYTAMFVCGIAGVIAGQMQWKPVGGVALVGILLIGLHGTLNIEVKTP